MINALFLPPNPDFILLFLNLRSNFWEDENKNLSEDI